MNTLKVLLLEDDPDDRFLTESVLEELKYRIDIQFVADSNELLASLQNDLPQLLLIDYNSRPDNGLKILQKIRSDEKLKALPVVILGDSSSAKYVKDCYASGANSVVRKPDNYSTTKNKIDTFFTYWMNVVEL